MASSKKQTPWMLIAILILLGFQIAVVIFSLHESAITTYLTQEGSNSVSCTADISNRTKLNSNEKPLIRTEDDLVIFYNLFTPNDESRAEDVLKITKEQMKYRQESVFPNATLYFISLGKEVTSIENCVNCKRLDYLPEGDEPTTLQKLHDFCKFNTNKDVVYIHNKGSFTPTHENELLRRMLTKSVFSKACLLDRHYNSMTKSLSSCKCNVCSARFSPLPHFHVSGNMWVASCSYISKLVPPSRMDSYMTRAVRTAPRGIFGRAEETLPIVFVGKGRYSAEHWVHSHPDVCPCDVYPGSFTWDYDQIALSDNWVPNLKKAPRFPFMQDYLKDAFLEELRKQKEGNWFSLRGRLHEWQSLYGTVPADDSWTWKYYNYSKEFNTIIA